MKSKYFLVNKLISKAKDFQRNYYVLEGPLMDLILNAGALPLVMQWERSLGLGYFVL